MAKEILEGKDYLGQPIKVGDCIVYRVRTELRKAKITKVMKKMVDIAEGRYVHQLDCIKITEKQYHYKGDNYGN